MATPRKHYFRVADSILREPWDRDATAVIVRLMAWLNQRWARDGIDNAEAGNAEMGDADCLQVYGGRNVARARAYLLRLADVTRIASLTIRERNARVHVSWPKFAEYQDFGNRKRPVTGLSPPLPTPTPTPDLLSCSKTRIREEDHSPSKTRESDGARAPSPPDDDPERWVSVLGQEPGSAEEKLAFVARELPLATAEAEEHHPRDRKAQRGKIRSVLIRHYRWQRSHPASAATRERPQTFHEISVANTMQAAQDALPLVLARQEEIERGERRRIKG